MKQLNELEGEYDDALTSILDSVTEMQRTLAGMVLVEYPYRELLFTEASLVRVGLDVSHVQVNAILDDSQAILVESPDNPDVKIIPCEDSLCVLSVGKDESLAVNDIQHDSFLKAHPTRSDWAAWASAVIHINGYAAGSICALEKTEPRDWSDADQIALERAAYVIGQKVTTWNA